MKIRGGYYIKARKIQESDIAFAPPHVREIWDWLLKEANHSGKGDIKRGMTMRSLRDMSEGLKWFVGYRKMMYSKSKCEMAMNWLRKHDMITTTKTTRGMIITVCNYDTYQDPKNYESNITKGTKATMGEQPSDTINKKNKEERIKEFKDKALEFKDKYSEQMIIKFVEYWCESGDKDLKLRFEKQSSFGISRRLATWKSNEDKFNNNGKTKQSDKQVNDGWDRGKKGGLRPF